MIVCAAAISGCSQTTEIDTAALAGELLSNGVYAEELTEVSAQITEKRYNLEEGEAEEIIAYAGTNAVVDEIAVFKTSDVESVEAKVEAHIEAQIKTYESYRPSEVSKLENGVVTVSGNYVIMCISEDSAKAEEIIDGYIK